MVLLWLLVLAPDFPLFGVVVVKKQASMDCRSFQAGTCCHLYLLYFFSFLHITVLINYFCPVSENGWHQCSQNSCCNGELKYIVYLYCCFLPVNWCRSYSFSVQIFLWNLLYRTEDLLALQRFCHQRAVLSHELPAWHGAALFCRLTQSRNCCRSLGAPSRTGASIWELCLPFPAHINVSEEYQFDLEGDTETNIGWEREQEREKLPGWRGKGRSGQGKGNEDRQKDRERTVSPFMRKGSLQIRMTEFSCSGHFIPMNLQLNAEVTNKRRAKRRYC